jgi:tripartite-type tricarboxylate transporter receptor subunit TctC
MNKFPFSRRALLGAGAGWLAQAALPGQALAQAGWPARTVRLVVPFPAGGGADLGARLLAQHLSVPLGKPVVVENRAGADGAIAAGEIARATPDGHTLYFATASSMSYVPSVRRAPPYDVLNDFAPITHCCTFTFFLMVHESIPGKTLEDVIAFLRANPGKYSYATANSTGIMGMAQLMKTAALDLVHVPYKGEAQTVMDLTTGRVQLFFATPAVTGSLLKDGKMRAVATLLPARSPNMPEVPTMSEAGQPLVNISPWGGFVAPARTPRDIIERLSRELGIVMAKPEVRDQMDKYGLPMRSSTPAEFGTFLKDQLGIWKQAVIDAKVPLQD